MSSTVTTYVRNVGFRSVAWLTTGEAVYAYGDTKETAETAALAKRDALNV